MGITEGFLLAGEFIGVLFCRNTALMAIKKRANSTYR